VKSREQVSWGEERFAWFYFGRRFCRTPVPTKSEHYSSELSSLVSRG